MNTQNLYSTKIFTGIKPAATFSTHARLADHADVRNGWPNSMIRSTLSYQPWELYCEVCIVFDLCLLIAVGRYNIAEQSQHLGTDL
jgi:hypothetical protein